MAAGIGAVMTLAGSTLDGRPSSSKVLVVDDDPAVRETLELVLCCEGHDVITAASGRAAIEMLQNVDVDVVITDLRMADMDGLETLRALKARRLETQVIVITGYASDETQSELLRCGAASIVRKPFSLEELFAAVQQALER